MDDLELAHAHQALSTAKALLGLSEVDLDTIRALLHPQAKVSAETISKDLQADTTLTLVRHTRKLSSAPNAIAFNVVSGGKHDGVTVADTAYADFVIVLAPVSASEWRVSAWIRGQEVSLLQELGLTL